MYAIKILHTHSGVFDQTYWQLLPSEMLLKNSNSALNVFYLN